MHKILDEQKKREICAILAVGCPRKVAARYVGCHVKTIVREAKRDAEFRTRLRHAESSHELRHLKHINEAAQDFKNWRAAAWMLERKYPQRYSRRKPGTLSTEQVVELIDRLAAAIIDEIEDVQLREKLLRRLAEISSTIPGEQTQSPPTAAGDDDVE